MAVCRTQFFSPHWTVKKTPPTSQQFQNSGASCAKVELVALGFPSLIVLMVSVDVGYSNIELEASSLCEVAARRQSAHHTHYSPCLQSQLPVTCNGELCPVHRPCGRSAQLRSPPTSGIGLRGFTTRIIITTGRVRRGRGGGGGHVNSRLKGWGGGYVNFRLNG